MGRLVIRHKNQAIPTHSLVLYLLFVLSCFHNVTLISWLILMPIILIVKYRKVGALEFLIFLQFRSLLSSGVAVPITGVSGIIKWSVIFLLSIYLLCGSSFAYSKIVNGIIILVVLFSFASLVFAWISSSYPMTATLKVLSYCVPFVGIIKGVSETTEIQWIKKINDLLGILVLGSSLLLFSSVGFLRNGRFFQGVFNHPNVYGVMIAIYIAGLYCQEKKLSIKTIIITIAAVVLLYQTKSRTGMISLLLVIVIFLVTQEIKLAYKLLLIVFTSACIWALLLSSASLITIINDYLFKGGTADILSSRSGQITKNIDRFIASPIIGTGFNVPYRSEFRSYIVSFDLVTENGNLFMAILGDVGVLGTILFFLAYIKIFFVGSKSDFILFIIPFSVCMGEMAFFSTNNFAIVLYFYFAIYIVKGIQKRSNVVCT